ncbi:hypothetical protein N7468_008046 [Penicillium chermesinum]|uniref:Uncharacterized protein n=1 Tax=Penicillium chermesinum TaxID=63820 RepID=A0A9W9TIA7_9EURO|nr:uncharacterized protein N7468_008046 [Penicillium chermesinum]KAJ5223504.1 hypothetical protein N7468_008046 [Penicillium chermesinum]
MNTQSFPDFKILPYKSKTAPDEKPPWSLNHPISLKQPSSWTYCGPLLELDLKQPSSFQKWHDATINGSLIQPLVSFLGYAHEILTSNNISHYWLTIRASTGSSEFDIPRWHTDELFFAPQPSKRPTHRRSSSIRDAISRAQRLTATHAGKRSRAILFDEDLPLSQAQIATSSPSPTNWKLTTTLLGPGTLFIGPETGAVARKVQQKVKQTIREEHPNHPCSSIRCVGCATASEAVRARLAFALSPHGIVQARRGECVFFLGGGRKRGPSIQNPAHMEIEYSSIWFLGRRRICEV